MIDYQDARNSSDGFSFELVRLLPSQLLPLRERLDLALLRTLVDDRPGASLKLLCSQVKSSQGIDLSVTSMSRALRRIGLSYKSRLQLGQATGHGPEVQDL
jgi:hypothetical protein